MKRTFILSFLLMAAAGVAWADEENSTVSPAVAGEDLTLGIESSTVTVPGMSSAESLMGGGCQLPDFHGSLGRRGQGVGSGVRFHGFAGGRSSGAGVSCIFQLFQHRGLCRRQPV